MFKDVPECLCEREHCIHMSLYIQLHLTALQGGSPHWQQGWVKTETRETVILLDSLNIDQHSFQPID